MDLKLSFDNLYNIRISSLRGEFIAQPKGYQQIPYQELELYSKGIFQNEKPEVFIQTSGGNKKPPKPIIASSLNLHLYHSIIIDIFKNKGFTGWDSYPVEVYTFNGELIKGYHAFMIKGVCGSYDINKSKIINYARDYDGRTLTEKIHQGLFFDPTSWDGSDIFTMENTWIDIVTEPVLNELKKLKVNLQSERLSEYLHNPM